MATLNEVLAQIEELKTIKSDLKEAIIAQGGEISDETPFAHYPHAINNLDNEYSFGVTIDDLIGSVDENGVLQPVDESKELHLSFNLLKKITGNDRLIGTFYGKKNVVSVDFPDLVEINDTGNSFSCTFYRCSNLASVKMDKLEKIIHSGMGGSCFYVFAYCTSLETIYFPKLTTLYPKGSAMEYMFSGCTNLTEIHFRVDAQSTVEALSGYQNKFGASNATIYFDL